MTYNSNNREGGQALVVLLVFTSMMITLLTAAIIITVVNSQATSKYTLGNTALRVAESGTENAIQRLIRDPGYSGETLTTDDGVAYITTSGTNPKTVTTEGVANNMRRKIQVLVLNTSGIINVSAWNEIE